MRHRRLFASVAGIVAVLGAVACSSSSAGSSGSGTSGGTSGAAGGASNCPSACVYYLQCKSIDSPENRTECEKQCALQGWSEQQLADFQQMDCASGVAAIERGNGGSSSGSSGSSGSSSGGKDCFNCQHDGTSCIYIGPLGGHTACDPSCC